MRRLSSFFACVLLTCTGAVPVARAGKAVEGVINLNTAPVEVLGLLPGIGPAKADEIVGYRRRRPFRTVDELVRIKGIGRKMVRGLRPHLAIAGPTTATTSASRSGGAPSSPPPSPSPSPRHPLCARAPVALASHADRRGRTERWPSHAAGLRPR